MCTNVFSQLSTIMRNKIMHHFCAAILPHNRAITTAYCHDIHMIITIHYFVQVYSCPAITDSICTFKNYHTGEDIEYIAMLL